MERRSTGIGLLRDCPVRAIVLFLGLIWAGFSPAAAIVTAPKNPNLVEGRIAIGMREELGEHIAEIEKILRANPRVRIGWPSEYEIAADPKWPEDFYLIDMNNHSASSSKRGWNEVPSYDEPAYAESVFLGRLDDGSFAAGLESALRKIARRWDLIALDRPPVFMRGASMTIHCVPSKSCDGTSDSRTLTTDVPLFLKVSVGASNPVPQFVYILTIGPDHEIEWLFQSANDNPAPPGSGFEFDFPAQPFTFDRGGKYEFITITSDRPIDTALLAPTNDGYVDRAKCSSILERVLCRAISGAADPTLLDDPWNFDAGWTINSLSTYYGKKQSVKTVGGGTTARSGSAPWAVQIYSARPYNQKQKDADLQLLDTAANKKFLDQLSAGQEEHRCGGSLIAPDIVLTAAHCLIQKDLNFLASRGVYLGSQALRGEPGASGADYEIVAAVYHAGYAPSVDRPSVAPPRNDLALLKIRPLGRRASARPIMLPDEVPGYGKSGPPNSIEVLGWGFTRARQANQAGLLSGGKPLAYATALQVGKLQLLATADCQRIPHYGAVTARNICAETPPPKEATRGSTNTFSCRGDSGGPVIRKMGQRTVQVGVVSWAYGCGLATGGAKVRPGRKNPSVFVNVASYTGWIARAKGSFQANKVIALPE